MEPKITGEKEDREISSSVQSRNPDTSRQKLKEIEKVPEMSDSVDTANNIPGPSRPKPEEKKKEEKKEASPLSWSPHGVVNAPWFLDPLLAPQFRPSTINKSSTISRFPQHIQRRKGVDAVISPRVVTIGPFFRRFLNENPDLEEIESKKPYFMEELCRKCRLDIDHLRSLLHEKIRNLEARARESYSEPFGLCGYNFVKMLVLDSCFIIHFLISISHEMHESLIPLEWNIKEIRSDLLLLENQIPLFVVCEVYDFFQKLSDDDKLSADFNFVVGQFMCLDIPWGFPEVRLNEANHLLHYYWLCFKPNPSFVGPNNEAMNIPLRSSPSDSNQANGAETIIKMKTLPPQDSKANWVENLFASDVPRNIPSATELHGVAGVIFEKRLSSHKEGCIVRFQNGIMEMPSLKIDESMKIILTNLVGYEKSLHPGMRPVSSYMLLMDSLINTEDDVKLLQQCGTLVNGLSTNLRATMFFNELGDMCMVDYQSHLYADLFRDVNTYYNSKYTREIATLRKNYFSNTWAIIGVFAAGFLLILAVVQTILAGIQTHYTLHPPKN